MCLIFVVRGVRRKFFYTEFFPNYGIYTQCTPAKVGIKSCRCAGGCVSFVYECNYPAAIIFDQTHVISIGNTG